MYFRRIYIASIIGTNILIVSILGTMIFSMHNSNKIIHHTIIVSRYIVVINIFGKEYFSSITLFVACFDVNNFVYKYIFSFKILLRHIEALTKQKTNSYIQWYLSVLRSFILRSISTMPLKIKVYLSLFREPSTCNHFVQVDVSLGFITVY